MLGNDGTNERLLNLFLDSTDQGIYGLDAKDRCIFINRAASEMLGLTPQEAIGQYMHDLIHHSRPDGSAYPVDECPIYRSIKTGNGSRIVEDVFWRRDRSSFPVEYSSYPVHEEGNITGAVVSFFDITERKRTEENLKESEEKFRSLFSEMSEGFALHEIIVDSSGKPCDYRFIDINPAFEKQTGLKRESIIGRTVKEILPGTEAYWIEIYGKVALTGEPVQFENYSQDLDSYYSVVAYSPQKGQFATLFLNITQRRRTEEILKKNEERLSRERTILDAIAQNTQAHLAYLDANFNFIWVNATYARAGGRSPDEFIGQNHFDLYPDKENEAIFKRVRDTGEPAIFKAKPFAHPDQQERGMTYWDWSLVPIKDSSGRMQGLVLSLTDVTELKQSEKAFDEERARLAAVLRSLPVGVIITEAPSGKVVVGNEKAIEIFHGSLPMLESIDEYSQYTGFHTDGRQYTAEEWPISRAAWNGEAISEEVELLLPDGSRRFMVISGAPVKDVKGRIINGVAVINDITEIKQAEISLREALEREERFSRLLQRALLPGEPVVGSGYDTAYAYVPAFASLEIGGDFYDVFKTESGKVGILIGDVTGKGIEAASLAAAARSTVRAFAYETSSPGESLTHSNDVLITQGQESGTFVTILLLVFDPETGSILYSSAGHPPPAICRTDGRVEYLSEGNLPVGVLKGWKYDEVEAYLDLTETIILYTDGITEARHNAKLFGEEGMTRILEGISNRNPDFIVNSLLNAASDWAEGKLRDDTALVAVQRLAM